MSDDPNQKIPPDPADPTVAWTPDPEPPPEPAEPAEPASPAEPVLPSATPGLISAAPVGWTGQDIGGGPGQPAPTPGAGGTPSPQDSAPAATPDGPAAPPVPPVAPGSPAAPEALVAAAWGGAPPPTGTAPPIVTWTQPGGPRGREVPGAPSLWFSDTPSRVVAYIIDIVIVGILAAIVGSVLGVAGSGTTITGLQDLDGFQGRSTFGGAGYAIVSSIISGLYFVGSWSGGRRATLGQRIFDIQVGNAFDGRAPTLMQALGRWILLGEFLVVLNLVPSLAGTASLLGLVWVIVLLLSTISSPTKQGLHDRFVNTAVVRPAGTSGSGAATACLVIIGLLLLLLVGSIVALIFLGGQASDVLERVGESI